MIGAEQSYMVISLAFAVFAAITAVGATVVLSIGFERMRNGFEKVKEMVDVLNRQTGFFSTAIHKMEQKVETLDARQGDLEHQTLESNQRTDSLVRYAETLVMQSKHDAQLQQKGEVPEIEPFIEPEEQVLTVQLSASDSRHEEVTKGEKEAVSSLYFGGAGENIRFV